MQAPANAARVLTHRVLPLLLVLVVAWLLWSGLYKPLVLGLGALSCVITVYIAHRIGFFDQPSGLHVIGRLPKYWMWLIGEIVKSSLQVTRIILHRDLPISPTLVTFDAEPKGPIGQAILGNAITLSPGTVTLDVHADKLRVHCLTTEGAQDLLEGDANRRSAELTDR